MALTAARVTVSTSAVALNTAGQDGGYLVIKNLDGTNGADLGTSAVTAGTGFPLPGAATPVAVTVFVKPGDVLYAIRSAGADVVLSVLRS
jgi:hypothetical protein